MQVLLPKTRCFEILKSIRQNNWLPWQQCCCYRHVVGVKMLPDKFWKMSPSFSSGALTLLKLLNFKVAAGLTKSPPFPPPSLNRVKASDYVILFEQKLIS